jgi:predicted nuclease of restriction endonuclease-like (RecB) superfamily
MKATLTFNLPEEQQDFDLAIKANALHSAIDRIKNEVFRPHRKHGYNDVELQELIKDPKVLEAISILEEKLFEILNEEDVNIY